MLVWLPIVLIFDKLLVISAREGLSGIPGQPTTCPCDYKSGKFDRCNSHELNWPLHVLAWNTKAQRFHPICRSTCLSIRNECSNASPVPPSSTWMEWREMTSKLDDIRICTRFFLVMQTFLPDTVYGMLRAARVLSAPTELHVHELKLVLRQWTTAQIR